MTSSIGMLIDVFRNKAPVSYASSSSGGLFNIFNRDSKPQQLEAYGSVSTLFAIVSQLANGFSQTGWHLYRKAPSGKKEDRTPVESHLALSLWNKPNDYYTGAEFREAYAQHLELTGEAWWVISYNENFQTIPLEMWPVRPDKIKPIPHPEEFISGYIYSGPDGEKVPLEKREVICIKMPNPLDLYRGMGPVQSLLADIDSAKHAAEWNRNFFLNSAEPGGVIEVPGTLNDKEFRILRTRWNEQHKGVAAAHRVAILEHGKWVDRKFSMRDMQFAELRNVPRELIREAFAYQKIMLGNVDDVNRASAQTGKGIFADWQLVPRLKRTRETLNHRYLPLFGTTAAGLEFDFETPTPPDAETDNAERANKTAAYKTLIEAKVHPEDAAAYCELPMGMRTVDSLGGVGE